MNKVISAIAAFAGMLSIILGAFGAHALKDSLTPESLQSYDTGVRYMFAHVLAVLLIQNIGKLSPDCRQRISVLFLLGILFFSGSIFLISLGIASASHIWFVTPLGGLLFVAGWIMSTVCFIKMQREDSDGK